MQMDNFNLVPQWDYQDSSNLVIEYDGCVISQGYITSFEAIDISHRTHQTREREDRGHIDDLIGSIEAVGLNRVPTVKYDPISGMFQPLGGHHRIISINKIRNNRKAFKSFQQFNKGFPVLVVSFPDKMGEEFFCVEDNNHEPAKTHAKNDVVKFFLRIDKKGHFENMDRDQAKREIYSRIDKTFSHLGSPRTKSTIFNSWLAQRGIYGPRAVYPSTEELYQEARVHWHLPADNDNWKLKASKAASDPYNENGRLVVGKWDPSRKTVFISILHGLETKKTYNYRIFTYLSCKVDSMVQARAEGLKVWANWNANQVNQHQVTEIVFRGQIDNEPHQRYIWCTKLKEFKKI